VSRPLLSTVSTGLALLVSLANPIAQDRVASPEPVIEERVEVRLVEVSFVATARKGGQPVTDLSVSDLKVKAAGKSYPVEFVELATPVVAAGEGPEVVLDLEIPGNTKSVQLSQPGARRFFVIFIDVENDAPLGRPTAAYELASFVERSLGERDLVSVVSYDGTVNVETAFTNDFGTIAAALSRAFKRPARAGIPVETRIRDLLQRLPDCRLRQRSRTGKALPSELCLRNRLSTYIESIVADTEEYYEALEELVRYAAAITEQTTILAVTHGKTYQPGYEFMEAVDAIYGISPETAQLRAAAIARGARLRIRAERLMREALDHDVVLYILDRSAVPSGVAGAEHGTPLEPGTRPYFIAYVQAQNDMASLALDSGGNIVRSADLTEGAVRALDFERGRYTLGFYVDRWLSEEELANIDVKSRRKGVKIRTGRGSHAWAKAPMTLQGKIGFGEPKPSPTRAGIARLPFAVALDPRQFGYEQDEHGYSAGLTFHLAADSLDGDPLADVFHFFSHGYATEVWENEREHPLVLRGFIEAPPGTYLLTAKVRHPKLDRGGHLVAQVDMPPLRAESESPSEADPDR
jgi:VWFA-related protein